MEDTDTEDVERDFRTMSRIIENIGFRDGIMDGKDNLSQGNFDTGYSQGFRMGLALGFCNEILNLVAKENDSNLSRETRNLLKIARIDPQLTDEERGHCLICNNSESENTLPDVIERDQDEANTKIVQDIKIKYASVLNEFGHVEGEKMNVFPPPDPK